MKMRMRKLGIFSVLCILLVSSVVTIMARTPYYSYFVDSNGEFTMAPDLYVPSHQITYNFNDATGMFVSLNDNSIFVSQKNSILQFSQSGALITQFGSERLVDARDVFVANEQIYVADNGLKQIVVFDMKGEYIKSYSRPDGQIFGTQTKFNPISVVVDNTGNLYIVSDQTSEGVIQLSSSGRFTGFVGVNDTYKTNVRKVQEILFPDDLVNQLSQLSPATINKVSIDQRGLIYTITSGSTSARVKKLNVAGRNIFEHQLSDSNFIKDMTVDSNGNVILLYDDYGFMEVFDSTGLLIAGFGSKTDSVVRDGLLRTPISIGVNSNSDLFVLDPALGAIQVFRTTEMMSSIFSAIQYFNDGMYEKSKDIWQDVLNVNNRVALAHRSIGMAYFKASDFDSALDSFKLANDKENYSEAFWEIRQAWLMSNTQYLLMGVVLLALIVKLVKYLQRKYRIIKTSPDLIMRIKSTKRYLDLARMKQVLFKPFDVFYDIRKGYVTTDSGIFLAILFVVAYAASIYLRGYLFSPIDETFSMINSLIKVFLVVSLFMVSNYLVCSIREGQGTKQAVFVSTMYALVPFILFMVPMSLLTQIITYNERFLLDFMSLLVYSYTAFLLVLSITEVHLYSLKFTLNNIMTIVITMLIILLFTVTFVVLSSEFINFILSIFKEVLLRV